MKVTKEDLVKFVTGFIEEMSYIIEAHAQGKQSSYYEQLFICVAERADDTYIPDCMYPGFEPWERVEVTYFASDTSDEDIQQEIERLKKMKERSKAFVIVACASDKILRHVQEDVASGRKKSIMFLCHEHQDDVLIYLKKKPKPDKKSDKRSFEWHKPKYKKYAYIED